MIVLLKQIEKLLVLGVVYDEQPAEVLEYVAIVRIKRWDLKRQPTYQVGLILIMLNKCSIFRNFLVFILSLTYDLVENTVNFANKYTDIIISVSCDLSSSSRKTLQCLPSLKNTNKVKCGYILEVV